MSESLDACKCEAKGATISGNSREFICNQSRDTGTQNCGVHRVLYLLPFIHTAAMSNELHADFIGCGDFDRY